MRAIRTTWPFDDAHYPSLIGKSDMDVNRFGILHMVLHITKEAGVLARIHERRQHRHAEKLSKRELSRVRKIAMKTIVSGFRLFMLAGGTAQELEMYVARQTTKT